MRSKSFGERFEPARSRLRSAKCGSRLRTVTGSRKTTATLTDCASSSRVTQRDAGMVASGSSIGARLLLSGAVPDQRAAVSRDRPTVR
jgi:hypothetical protein